MLQSISAVSTDERRNWLALLARAPIEMLEAGLDAIEMPRYEWLRRPETGLYMIRGRVGGNGNRFNLGEVTATRCVLRLADAGTGIGYVLGRSHRHAELVALADGLLQSAGRRVELQRTLLAPIERHVDEIRRRMARKAQATRVEFMTVAREAGRSGQSGQSEQFGQDAA